MFANNPDNPDFASTGNGNANTRKDPEMYESEISLETLAARARGGDMAALAELRSRMAPQMVRIVRRAMRADTPSTPLTRQIRATAEALSPRGFTQAPLEPSGLIKRVARRLFQVVTGETQRKTAPSCNLQETVRC
jgi:hypothetical protein